MNKQPNKATDLQTQILCANSLHKHCIDIIAYELNFLTPFIGLNILKVDGSFKAKYDHEKMQGLIYKTVEYGFNYHIDTHYYFTAKYGKLSIEVITSASGGGADKNGVCTGHRQMRKNIDLFALDTNGNLQPVEIDKSEISNIYNEADILAAANKIKQAAQQYNNVLHSLPYMFRQTLFIQELRS
jgi:hypothetical protein